MATLMILPACCLLLEIFLGAVHSQVISGPSRSRVRAILLPFAFACTEVPLLCCVRTVTKTTTIAWPQLFLIWFLLVVFLQCPLELSLAFWFVLMHSQCSGSTKEKLGHLPSVGLRRHFSSLVVVAVPSFRHWCLHSVGFICGFVLQPL